METYQRVRYALPHECVTFDNHVTFLQALDQWRQNAEIEDVRVGVPVRSYCLYGPEEVQLTNASPRSTIECMLMSQHP